MTPLLGDWKGSDVHTFFFVSVVCIGGTRIIILVICRLLTLYYVVDVYNTVVVVRQLYLGKLIGKVIYLCSSDIGL